MQTAWIWMRHGLTLHLIVIQAVWHIDNILINFEWHWNTFKIEADEKFSRGQICFRAKGSWFPGGQAGLQLCGCSWASAHVDLLNLVSLLYFLYPWMDCFHIWTVALVDGSFQCALNPRNWTWPDVIATFDSILLTKYVSVVYSIKLSNM